MSDFASPREGVCMTMSLAPNDPRRAFLADPAILGALRRLIAGLVPAQDVEEPYGQTLIEALEQDDSPRERDPFVSHLLTAGKRNAIDWLKRRASLTRNLGTQTEDDPQEIARARGAAPDDASRENLRLAQKEMDAQAASPGGRRATEWLWRRVNGESYAKIAADAGVPKNTVEKAVSRLRAQLVTAVGVLALLAIAAVAGRFHGIHRAPGVAHPAPDAPSSQVAPPAPSSAPSAPSSAPSGAPPAQSSGAAEMRAKALAHCHAHEWAACLEAARLARAFDPSLADDPELLAAQKEALAHVAREPRRGDVPRGAAGR
jgi:DNA-directed RNA polymerase specialized sigma24 family protein